MHIIDGAKTDSHYGRSLVLILRKLVHSKMFFNVLKLGIPR